jgi:hypothetical protein
VPPPGTAPSDDAIDLLGVGATPPRRWPAWLVLLLALALALLLGSLMMGLLAVMTMR